MGGYTIIPGRGKVKNDNSIFGCGIYFESNRSSHRSEPSHYEKTKAQVYATGNKWEIEKFEATHS